jgi:anti-sigma-K factor RskA
MSNDHTRDDDLAAAAALAVLGIADTDDLALLAGAGPDGDAARRAMADTAAALAFTLPPITPPPFASIAARLPAATVTPLRRRTALPWAITATTAVAAATLAVLWLGARNDAITARTSSAIALAGARDQCRRDIAAYDTRLTTITSPHLQLATVRGAAGGTAKVFIDPDHRRWLVLAFELPPVPDKDYQLWFVPEGGAPVSAGLLTPGPDGVLGATPAVPTTLGRVRPAISLEPRGGSSTPTEVKLVGDLI